MRQANVVFNEGSHEGGPYKWDNYLFPHYREFDYDWNYNKVSLSQSSDVQTMTDAISVTPIGVETGLGKTVIQKKAIDMPVGATIKAGIKKALEYLHGI